MNWKKIVLWVVVVLVVVGVILYAHYTKPAVVLVYVLSLVFGALIGWVARVLYVKYIKE